MSVVVEFERRSAAAQFRFQYEITDEEGGLFGDNVTVHVRLGERRLVDRAELDALRFVVASAATAD